MSDLSDLIIPAAVMPRATANTSTQALQLLSVRLAEAAGLDARAVFNRLLMRERLAGTGVGEGVAIPHAMIDGLARPIGGFARFEPALDFKALDARPADLVFILLTPKDRGGDHLRALARIARFFKRADMRERLRAARSTSEILAVFAPQLAADVA